MRPYLKNYNNKALQTFKPSYPSRSGDYVKDFTKTTGYTKKDWLAEGKGNWQWEAGDSQVKGGTGIRNVGNAARVRSGTKLTSEKHRQ